MKALSRLIEQINDEREVDKYLVFDTVLLWGLGQGYWPRLPQGVRVASTRDVSLHNQCGSHIQDTVSSYMECGASTAPAHLSWWCKRPRKAVSSKFPSRDVGYNWNGHSADGNLDFLFLIVTFLRDFYLRGFLLWGVFRCVLTRLAFSTRHRESRISENAPLGISFLLFILIIYVNKYTGTSF